jgi:brefeldin A-resistance guanine nucleotide exchange factor 1
MKRGLKIQLEVFLQSIHLRILSSPSSSTDVTSNLSKELALLSLLEFSGERDLMVDIYVNYDCSLTFSNLFDNIVSILHSYCTGDGINNSSGDKQRFGVLQRMGGIGIIDIVEGIWSRCSYSKHNNNNAMASGSNLPPGDLTRGSTYDSEYSDDNYGGRDSVTDDAFSDTGDSVDMNVAGVAGVAGIAVGTPTNSKSISPEGFTPKLELAASKTASVIAVRKKKKEMLTKGGRIFNDGKKNWIEQCRLLGVFDTDTSNCSKATPSDVAGFLYNAPGIDRCLLGEYLSKGPVDKYPFNASVLSVYTSMFDFCNLSFGSSLRKFLTKFRLPGEAQCIDRLMESFSLQVYKQCNVDNIFANEDAAFILSFSTIMLNTDLHNPNLLPEKRMTLEQFVRNNRGINDGADIDVAFLEKLYHHIKDEEIQVTMDTGSVADDVRKLDGLLERAEGGMEGGMFYEVNANTINGIHEKDMWLSISKKVLSAIVYTLDNSKDDVVVSRCYDGLYMYCELCEIFDDKDGFNTLIVRSCKYGSEFVRSACVSKITGRGRGGQDLVIQSVVKKSFLKRFKYNKYKEAGVDTGKGNTITGSAEYKELLLLVMSIHLSSLYTHLLSNGWTHVIELLFLLKNSSYLPNNLSYISDFCDPNNNVLPNSPFKERSETRSNEYVRECYLLNVDDSKTWWDTLFGSAVNVDDIYDDGGGGGGGDGDGGDGDDNDDNNCDDNNCGDNDDTTEKFIKELMDMASLDTAFTDIGNMSDASLFGMINYLLACRPLHDVGDETPSFEQQSAWILELCSRVLLRSGDRGEKVWDIMIQYLNKIMKINELPYLVERGTVFILRAGIYLHDTDNVELKKKVMNAFTLITFVPDDIMRHICDRVGSGIGIIMRQGGFIDSKNGCKSGWSVVTSLIDKTSQFSAGREYGWDGIKGWLERVSDDDINTGFENGGLYYLIGVLLKFVNGSYQGDMKTSLYAMDALSWLWGKNCHKKEHVFLDIVNTFHECLKNRDHDVSKKASKLLNKILCTTKAESLCYDNWLKLFNDVLLKPPPIVQRNNGSGDNNDIINEDVRVTCTETLARVVLLTLPRLLKEENDNVSRDIQSIMSNVVIILGENVKAISSTGYIFENTVQLVQNMFLVMGIAEDFDAGYGIGEIVKTMLLEEMESAGAGAVLEHQKLMLEEQQKQQASQPHQQQQQQPQQHQQPPQQQPQLPQQLAQGGDAPDGHERSAPSAFTDVAPQTSPKTNVVAPAPSLLPPPPFYKSEPGTMII